MTDDFQNGWGVQALDAEQLNRRYETAVISGCVVSDGADPLEHDVTAGDVLVEGTEHSVSSKTVTLTGGYPNPRKDLIYVDSSGVVQVKEGNPHEAEPDNQKGRDVYSPRPPDLSGVSGCPLAEVWVGIDASDTDTSDISDRRIFANPRFGSATLTRTYLDHVDYTPNDSEIGSGNVAFYAKSDDVLYKRPYGGTEEQVGSGGALSDSGNDTDGGDDYQLPTTDDNIDLQSGGGVRNADVVSTDKVIIGSDQALISRPASGQVTLSSGLATVDTGLSITDATFYLALGVDDPDADAKVTGRLFWDDSAGTYKIEIVEDGTSVGNPTVNYDVLRVR